MKHIVIAAALALAITAADAQVQTAPNIITGTLPDGAPIYSAVGNGVGNSPPLPTAMYPSQNMRTVAGPMQINVPLTAATGLTVPPNAKTVTIQANGTNGTNGHCLRWRDDGVDPVAGSGMTMNAGDSMTYSVVGFPIKMINAVGATCVFTAAYYF